MMKLLFFLRWKLKQVTFDDICWWIGSFFVGAGLAYDINQLLLIIGFSFWILIFVKFLINHFQREYQKFNEEQKDLLNTIKNSDTYDH